jgi:hypothetical protein
VPSPDRFQIRNITHCPDGRVIQRQARPGPQSRPRPGRRSEQHIAATALPTTRSC